DLPCARRRRQRPRPEASRGRGRDGSPARDGAQERTFGFGGDRTGSAGSRAGTGSVLVLILPRDVVLANLTGSHPALVGIGNVLDALDDTGFVGLALLDELF